MLSKSIYIDKEEYLSICLFVMHFHTIRANAIKLSSNSSFIKEKVKDYFFPESIGSSSAKSPPLCLTNQISATGSIGELLSSTLCAQRIAASPKIFCRLGGLCPQCFF
jgi:hypothetical protein